MRTVPLDAHLMTESDALTGGSTRPVAILFVLDLLERLEFLRDHIHAFILSAREFSDGLVHEWRASITPAGASFENKKC
jgi:hypothetical protein